MRDLPMAPGPGPPERRGAGRFVALALAVALAAVAGYTGYVLYPRFGLPSIEGVGSWLLAAGAGVASFFSPCSFPLLLTLLGRRVGAEPEHPGRAAVVFAGAFSAGAAAFLVLLGLLIAAGGSGLAGAVTFTSTPGIAIRITVGLLLVFLGLVQAEVLPVSFHAVERRMRPLSEAQARLRRHRPLAGTALFGLSYLLIGFG